MVRQTDATFQEVFFQVSLADSIKLLPWCIFSPVPPLLHEWNDGHCLQQDEDVPTTTTTSEPEGSLASGHSSSPAHQPGTPPLQVPPLPDILFVGTLLVGYPCADFLAISTQKSETTLPVVHLTIITTRRPALTSKRSKLGVNTALPRVMRACLNLYQELGPALNNKSRNLPAPPIMVLWQEAQGVPVISPHLT